MGKIVEAFLKLSIDKGGATKELAAADAAVAKIGQDAKSASGGFDTLRQSAKGAADSAVAGLQELRAELNAAEQQTKDLADSSKGVDFSGASGHLSSGLSALRGVAGGGSAGDALGVASDVTGAIEQIKNLKSGVVELASGAAQAFPVLGKVGGAVSNFAGPLVESLGGLGPVGLAAGAAVAATVIALKGLSDQAEEARKQVQAQVEASKQRIANEREVSDFLKAGDTEGAKARLEELKAQQEDANKLLTELYVARDGVDKAYADLGASLNPAKRNELGAKGQELDKQIAAAYGDGFEARAKEIQALEAALPQIDRAANARDKEEQSAKKLGDTEEQVAAKREQHTQRIAALDAQAASVSENFAQQRVQVEQDRALAAKREQEDYQQGVVQHFVKIAALQKDGLKRIADIRAEGVKAEAEAAKKLSQELAKVSADAAKATAKENSSYQQNSQKAAAAYAKNALQQEKDYQLQRKRALEDANASIQDAELSNDVLALSRAQRSRDTEQQRAAEDFTNRQQQQAQQYAEEQAAAQQAHQQRLADIAAEAAQRTADLQAQAAEEKAARAQQLAERIAAEQEATRQRIASEVAAQAQADADRQKRLQRQLQDQQIADQRARDANQRQLRDIQTKRDAEVQALSAVLVKVQQIGSAAAGISAGFRSSSSGSSSGSHSFIAGATNSARTTGGRIVAFDDGGVVPGHATGSAYFGKRSFAEAVLPLTPDVLSKFGQGAAQTPISVDLRGAVFHGEVTATDVQNAIYKAVGAINGGIAGARRAS